jgi:hypothetical protein
MLADLMLIYGQVARFSHWWLVIILLQEGRCHMLTKQSSIANIGVVLHLGRWVSKLPLAAKI